MLAKLNRRMKSEGGFTLIELLIVLIIIGILVAIAVPSYLGFRDRAQNRAAQSNVRAAVPAMEACFSDQSTYVGCDAATLKASYDAGLAVAPVQHGISIAALSGTSYEISAVGKTGCTWTKAGPGAEIVGSGTC